jgi:superfamily II DNA or RNA helicase/HKD family nuclease
MVDDQPGRALVSGLYDTLITNGLEQRIQRAERGGQSATRGKLDPAEAPATLASYLAELLEERLAGSDEGERIDVANAVIDFVDARLSGVPDQGALLHIDHVVASEKPILQLVQSRDRSGLASRTIRRPEVPLGQSDLLINGRGEPNLIRSLASEVDSADRIRIIVSFIKWSGLVLILPELEKAIQRGALVEVLTTTYLAASDQRAINALVEAGANVRISYDGRGTRLHAKAWLFDRKTGFHTGYIGSSNMSVQAMSEGMEWNVRLSEKETPHLLNKFRATFDAYWQDPANGFEPYDPALRPADMERLRVGLQINAMDGYSHRDELSPFDLNPYRFQEEMLDDLRREREVYHRYRNLVVAATGTGKTIVAAFDYRRLAEERRWSSTPGRFPRLLFVAHRKEILTQSRRVFRQVLKDVNFGELLVDGQEPATGDHVFASIQSLSAGDRLVDLRPDFYDVVIVDEFHHAAADTWNRFLTHVKPKILLGLTATPERPDGQDVTEWFDGRIATELRLWEALERDLLVPFHYFAVGSDDLDFSRARWNSGRYNTEDLEDIYTGNDLIMRWAFREITHKVTDPKQMKALFFTSGVRHAAYVARELNRVGIAAVALNAQTRREERSRAVRDLREGVLQAIVTVDLFNEGVDIPEVDTVVMLRPTESGTVFLQQLGRGLRKTPTKSFLTVLDFIGLQRKEFRYDVRFRALTGVGRRRLEKAIAQGFPYLPAGAFIQLDEVASRLVMENIKAALPTTKKAIAADIRQHAAQSSAVEYRLARYLADSGLDLVDVYGSSNRSWTELARLAGLATAPPTDDDSRLLKRVATMLHIDDQPRLDAYRRLLTEPDYARSLSDASPMEQRLALMLYHSIWPRIQHRSVEEGLLAAQNVRCFREELLQAWEVTADRFTHVTRPIGDGFDGVPLSLHARYSRAEMLTAVGHGTMEKSPYDNREGVIQAKDLSADVFNVTWQKVEGRYSPHTMYRDYAMTDRLIHWQSQHADREASTKIQRYIHHAQNDHRILLFARETPDWEFGTRPYLFLGTAQYVRHEGERPVSFVWRLDEPLPTDFMMASQLLAG